MNDDQRSLLRKAILLALNAVSPRPLPFALLKLSASEAGFKLTDDVIEREMDYLCEKGHSTKIEDELSVGLRQWKLSAIGREYLERKGLV